MSEKISQALAEAILTYCSDLERTQADGFDAKASMADRPVIESYVERWRAIYDTTMTKC